MSTLSVLAARWVLALPALACSLEGHDIITTKLTYTRDISRIFAQHCVACHGEGYSIPLARYTEVRPWAVAIKEQVLARAMPPWGAIAGFGDLAPQRALPEEDMLVIAAWVLGGAPEGDPTLAPKAATTARAAVPAVRPKAADHGREPLLVVSTRVTLPHDLDISGIRPLPEVRVASIRIVATLPGGGVEPLLWLYGYEPEWHSVFRYARQIKLPAGTTVEASGPLRFALIGDD